MIYILFRRRCDEIPLGIFSIITKYPQGQLVYHFQKNKQKRAVGLASVLYVGMENLGYSLESPISRTICLTTSTFTVEASSLS